MSILGIVSAPSTPISGWLPLIRQRRVSHVQVLVVRTTSTVSPTAVDIQATPTASIAAGEPRRGLVASVGHAIVVARVTIETVVDIVVAVVMVVVVAVVAVEAISVGSRHRSPRRHRSTVGHPGIVGVHSRLLGRCTQRLGTAVCFVDNTVSVGVNLCSDDTRYTSMDWSRVYSGGKTKGLVGPIDRCLLASQLCYVSERCVCSAMRKEKVRSSFSCCGLTNGRAGHGVWLRLLFFGIAHFRPSLTK